MSTPAAFANYRDPSKCATHAHFLDAFNTIPVMSQRDAERAARELAAKPGGGLKSERAKLVDLAQAGGWKLPLDYVEDLEAHRDRVGSRKPGEPRLTRERADVLARGGPGLGQERLANLGLLPMATPVPARSRRSRRGTADGP